MPLSALSFPFILNETHKTFPDPRTAMLEPNGLLAIGGDLSLKFIMQAYSQGIFPWFMENDPILWWSPDPRMVLFLDELKISRSLKKFMKKNLYSITFNQAFAEVIKNCAGPRKNHDATWITAKMQDAYIKLHEQGHAFSIETWHNDKLVGGLYGIIIKKIFCGESMFSREPNASKIAIVYLVEWLKKQDFKLLDCQIYNPHLASLGAREISREEYLEILER